MNIIGAELTFNDGGKNVWFDFSKFENQFSNKLTNSGFQKILSKEARDTNGQYLFFSTHLSDEIIKNLKHLKNYDVLQILN